MNNDHPFAIPPILGFILIISITIIFIFLIKYKTGTEEEKTQGKSWYHRSGTDSCFFFYILLLYLIIGCTIDFITWDNPQKEQIVFQGIINLILGTILNIAFATIIISIRYYYLGLHRWRNQID
jgi:hypothetical protein